jgi:nucleoside-triphosphatase
MHIFLTGPRGVGKSTVIERVVGRLVAEGACAAGGVAGFRTEWFDLGGGDALYILPYGASVPGGAARPVAGRDAVRRSLVIHPNVFDEDGVAILRASGAASARLIVMDELGFMESGADAFRGAVMEVLDGDVPVLGVVRLEGNPFLDAVKDHGRVRVIHVSESNRNMLFEQLTAQVFHG